MRKIAAGQCVRGAQVRNSAFELDLAALRSRPRTEIDHVVGDRDRLRLVLHDQDRVALVPQPQQQPVHPLDVVRVQAHGRLVEDVRDVGQGRPEVAHHLDPLRLTTRQRRRLTIQREIPESDLDQRFERVPQGAHHRRHRLLRHPAEERREVADLHGRALGDVAPTDPRLQDRRLEPGAVTVRAGRERGDPIDERADVRLRRLPLLRQIHSLDLEDQTLVRRVDARDPQLDRRLVQEVVPLPLGEVPQRLVRVEEPGVGETPHIPAADREVRHRDRALIDRLLEVHQAVDIDAGHPAQALARRAHPLGVERIGQGAAGTRLAEASEQDPQHGVRVGDRPERRTGVRAHPLLIHHDRRTQIVQRVHIRPGRTTHERLDERRIRLVDQPLRLGGDGAEDERRLAGAGNPGEDGEPMFRNVQRDVAKIVLAGPADLDELVPVRIGEVRPCWVLVPVRIGEIRPCWVLVPARIGGDRPCWVGVSLHADGPSWLPVRRPRRAPRAAAHPPAAARPARPADATASPGSP